MTEPDVTLTDYALAAACALFAYLLCFRRGPAARIPKRFALLFALLALASVLGGTVHGFFLEETSVGYRVLWPATLLAIGGATFAAWLAGAAVVLPRRAARVVGIAAMAQFVTYGGVVLYGVHDFGVAIANALPANVFLVVVYAMAYARRRVGRVLVGLAGILSTFIAAGVQQAEFALHPVYFNHNALYHLIQGLALFLIFHSVQALTTADDGRKSPF